MCEKVNLQFAIESIELARKLGTVTIDEWIEKLCQEPKEKGLPDRANLFLDYKGIPVLVKLQPQHLPREQQPDVPTLSGKRLAHFGHAHVFLYHPTKGHAISRDSRVHGSDLEDTLEALYRDLNSGCQHRNAQRTGYYSCVTSYRCPDCGHTWALDSSD